MGRAPASASCGDPPTKEDSPSRPRVAYHRSVSNRWRTIMAQPPSGLGHELTVMAARPLSAYVDAPRVRLGARLEDGSELFLWMTAEQFRGSLPVLQHSARKLGIPWPSTPTEPAKGE